MKSIYAATLALIAGGLFACSGDGDHRDLRDSGGVPQSRGGDRDASTRLQSDPVCGMTVNPLTSRKEVYAEQTFYFDSEDCAKKFRDNPHVFLPDGDDRDLDGDGIPDRHKTREVK